MKLKKAIKILSDHNKWRLGGEGEMTNPKELTSAIEVIISDYRESEKHNLAAFLSASKAKTDGGGKKSFCDTLDKIWSSTKQQGK